MRMVYETSATFLAMVLLFLVESAQSSPINSTRVSGKEQADVMVSSNLVISFHSNILGNSLKTRF